MKRYIHTEQSINSDAEDIFCISDVRGRNIKVESNIPFSFYYSVKNSSRGPRIKPVFNPDKVKISQLGVLKLCDDWKFTPGTEDKNISGSKVSKLIKFAKKYLVLFLLVWEDKVESEPLLRDYLEGDISLEEFIQNLEFYNGHKEELDQVYTVEQLEEVCRELNLVNFYGN